MSCLMRDHRRNPPLSFDLKRRYDGSPFTPENRQLQLPDDDRGIGNTVTDERGLTTAALPSVFLSFEVLGIL